MITSRVGDKHRARAIEIGVDDYLRQAVPGGATPRVAIGAAVARRREPAVASGGGGRR